jgi:hypothetical protein
MSNSLLTPSVIAKEALMMLVNNLVMGRKVNRQYKEEFVKVGSTVTIRKPNRFTVSSGAALSVQDVAEPSTSITVDQQKHVDFSFSSVELTLTIEEFSNRYLQPAMEALANKVDYDLCALYKNVYNCVGTPGTTPATFAALGSASQRMDEEAARQSGRSLVVNPAAQWSLADAFKGLFNPSGQIGTAFKRGSLGTVANLDIGMDQNVNMHTNGARGGTPLVNGASQTGSSLITDGWTAAAATRVKQGDVFTISSGTEVYAVNPQSRQSTGARRQFVVTADTASDGSGNATLPISPPITTSGAYQTVTASPDDNAALTFVGNASAVIPQNIAFTENAFGLVTVPLELPQGVHFAAREEYEGISLRIVRQYDINNDVIPTRVDVLYGTKTLYPEEAVRLVG